jgi:hypothetical protein
MDFFRFKTERLYGGWTDFKKKRTQLDYDFNQSNPYFLTMIEREGLIDELFKRLGFHES